jgi:hypothetical protein
VWARRRQYLAAGTFYSARGRLRRGGVIAIRVHRTFSLDSKLHFTIVERPALGSVRVFDRAGDDAELVYPATNEADSNEWLIRYGYPHVVLEQVTADEVGADIVEGRAVA